MQLNLRNCRDHPTNQAYKVFFFTEEEHANSFQERLEAEELFFERNNPDEDEHRIFFAVKRIDMSKVERMNNLTLAQYKKPFIPHKGWRWALFLFCASVITLALIGYLLSNR